MPPLRILVSYGHRTGIRAAVCLLCMLGSATVAASSESTRWNGTFPFSGGRKPRIAIIGAGIGGASTAYYLNKLLAGDAIIHVYVHLSCMLEDAENMYRLHQVLIQD